MVTIAHITQADNLIKYCIKCNHGLELGTNWASHNQKDGRYICTDCQNKQIRDRYKFNHPHYGELLRNNVTQMDNSTKYCNTCKCELIIDKNWSKGMQNASHYTCKKCNSIKCKQWRENHPSYNKINTDIWRIDNPEKKKLSDASWRNNNQEKIKEYRKSTIGKIANNKSRDKRKRNLGYELLFNNIFPDNIPVVGHHASDGFVFYLPESLHLNHLHGSNTKLHRDELQPYIEAIYNISYIIEEGD